MLRRFSFNFAVFSMIIDMLVVVISMSLSVDIREWMNTFSFIKPIPGTISLPLPLYFLFPILSVLVFSTFDIYDGKKYLRVVDEYGALTLSWMILSVSLAGILYFSFRDVSRALFLTFIFIVYIGLLTWRSFTRLYFRLRNGHREDAARRVLVIGVGPLGQRVGEEMSRQEVEVLRVVGYLDDILPAEGETSNLLGSLEDVVPVVQAFRITDVVIALPYSVYPKMARIVMALEEQPVRVWVALGFFDLALYRMGVADFAGIPMLDLRAPALSEYQLLTKRAFDLLIGALGMVTLFPLMVVASALIWFEDRSPIIYRQKRVGENGRIFTVYKFRTMVPGAEKLQSLVESTDEKGNTIHKIKDDPRVTRVGKLLRRMSIDELPQLVNVLQGTMSMVGPRPELPYLVERYQPWQRKRFSVPPGITGWWQVIGRSDRPMHLHTEDDLYYIQNYSIWLDIQILVRTIWVVVIGRGSY
jgi:exopolysaccharide biosynthesis polyprenyl glycosylphosphotransferase